jgi:predicted RNase H-like HicB family nuclease
MSRRITRTKFTVTKDGVKYEFQPTAEGGYVVTVPLYPSCASQGDTFEEALANIRDALDGCLAVARDLNLPIPEKLRHLMQQTVKP